MRNDETSEPAKEEIVAKWKDRYGEGTKEYHDKWQKIILRRLITIIGILSGAIIGVGVTFLIGFIAEVISQPKYPDLMMDWYLWPLLVYVPLFAAIFGILFHRLVSRF